MVIDSFSWPKLGCKIWNKQNIANEYKRNECKTKNLIKKKDLEKVIPTNFNDYIDIIEKVRRSYNEF